MAYLILLRHGQSIWNKQNLFTGWVDIPLSEEGIQESKDAGKKIAKLPIDVAYSSSLIRAHMTLVLALLHHESGKIPMFLHPGQGKMEEWAKIHSEEVKKRMLPVYQAWQLNERMYGSLQGLNKAEMVEKFGAEQVQIWRRSFDGAPPGGESLAMTAARAWPYFQTEILPRVERGENVFISAHGNSLRAILMHLDHLSKEQVVQLELATGDPVVYRFHGKKYERADLPR